MCSDDSFSVAHRCHKSPQLRYCDLNITSTGTKIATAPLFMPSSRTGTRRFAAATTTMTTSTATTTTAATTTALLPIPYYATASYSSFAACRV